MTTAPPGCACRSRRRVRAASRTVCRVRIQIHTSHWKQKLDPRAAVVGNAYRNDHQLPRGLLEALIAFEDCADLQEVLGKRFSHVYLALKRSEFEEFMRVISPWEREHLLLSV